MSTDGFVELLGERSRLLILTALAAVDGTLDFSTLLDRLGLSRGNLSVHLRRLEESGLVSSKKEFVERKPRSSYECTEEGRIALQQHLRSVEKLIRSALKGREKYSE